VSQPQPFSPETAVAAAFAAAREGEDAFRCLLEQTPAAMYRTDRDGTVDRKSVV